MRDDGFREILAVEVSDTESEATYRELFRSLKARGLKGVELVFSDDHEGLKAAVERHFQGASWQRCQVHYMRNLLGMMRAKKRKELAAELRAIFPRHRSATDEAIPRACSLAGAAKGHEKVACHLEEYIEECLACLASPESYRRRIRTTNGLERSRVRRLSSWLIVRIFPNREACWRLVVALAVGGGVGG